MSQGGRNRIYFIGIGGIGMSGLARYYHSQGWDVSGYDRTETAITQELQHEGIYVHYDDDIASVNDDFLSDPNLTVVRTPAVPTDSELVTHWGIGHILKRAEILGRIAAEHETYAVAGTHGKTTASSMLAHILKDNALPINAFLGGITNNYKSNVLLDNDATSCVVEADEFDRSFLHLHPKHAVITSVDADHLDIYGSSTGIIEGYKAFAEQVTGSLILNEGVSERIGVAGSSYGLNGSADYHACNIRVFEGEYRFDIVYPNGKIEDVTLGMAGRHNVENAVAATALALLAGVAPSGIKSALGSFKGIERRFNVLINTNNRVLVDDYAHHPTELTAAILSAREMFPGRNLTVAFQPHLFSRTKDFATGFANSLSMADQLILLDIYPAREEPIPGVTSEWLARMIDLDPCIVCGRHELKDQVSSLQPDVLLVLGAGDIGLEVQGLKEMLETQQV